MEDTKLNSRWSISEKSKIEYENVRKDKEEEEGDSVKNVNVRRKIEL